MIVDVLDVAANLIAECIKISLLPAALTGSLAEFPMDWDYLVVWQTDRLGEAGRTSTLAYSQHSSYGQLGTPDPDLSVTRGMTMML